MPSLKERFGGLIDEAGEFSGTAAAETAAAASFEALREPLEESVESLRGSQVARGRLNTGFGFQDEDRLVRDALKNLNVTLARNALGAAGLDLEALGLRGDLLSGALDRETAEKNAKRRRRAGLFGLGGAILGNFVPGVGPVVGGLLGEAVGGFF